MTPLSPGQVLGSAPASSYGIVPSSERSSYVPTRPEIPASLSLANIVRGLVRSKQTGSELGVAFLVSQASVQIVALNSSHVHFDSARETNDYASMPFLSALVSEARQWEIPVCYAIGRAAYAVPTETGRAALARF